MDSDKSTSALDKHEVYFTQREIDASKGTFILCHGIAMDRDEYKDFFVRIANFLQEEGFSSVRFDFRGHGESEMSDLDFTVSGTIMDLEAVLADADQPIHIIASSFGAIPSILCLEENDIESLVLLCPLIDTRDSYFRPKNDSFVDRNVDELEENGYITRPDGLRMSAGLLYELRSLRLPKILQELETPVLTVQAGEDSKVSPDISRKHGAPNDKSKYFEIEGAEHGLIDPEDGNSIGERTDKNWMSFENILAKWIE